jgi:superfamily II DNA or RNA helicase
MRKFSKKQKQALYLFSGGYCQNCGNLLPKDWHADHKTPYSKGGKTDVINGQAFCPHCNLVKGDKMLELRPLPKDYKLRIWQQRCFNEYIASLKKQYLVMATPGAGKTDLSILIARYLLERHLVDMFVIVTPFQNLKEQWADDCNRLGCDTYSGFEIDIPGRGIIMPQGEYHGLITSYQQVAIGAASEAFRLLCHKLNVLVVFDEPHHCSDGNSWGEATRNAFELAKSKLSITGTPYRTDTEFIPFVDYNKIEDDIEGKKYEVVMDFVYSYGDAINEPKGKKVVRLVEFPQFEGEATWIERVAQKASDGLYEWANEPITKKKTLEEQVSINDARKRLNTILMADGDWVNAIIEAANQHLNSIRDYEQWDAGGVIFAKDIRHAKEIAEVVQRITGTRPIIVTHGDKDPDAMAKIKAFNDSSAKWIIAVKIISEGINIKRLRVGVYLTNVTTRMFFAQTLGRIQRWQQNVTEPQIAAFFVPRVEPFVTYIDEITEVISHSIMQNEDILCYPDNGSDNDRERNNWTEYIKAEGREKDREFMGEKYSVEELRQAEEIQTALDLQGIRTIIQIAQGLRGGER